MDVNTNYSSSAQYNSNATTTSTQSKADNTNATTAANSGANSTNTAYVNEVNKNNDPKKSYKVDAETVKGMKNANNLKLDAFRSMVEKLISKQGNTSKNIWQDLQSLVKSGNVDQATIDAAKAEIGEDGYYGVKKTSERIFEFAKAISGGDPSKIEELKKAVEKGFKAAEKMWGDKLPDICNQTYDATMKLFDNWAAEAKAAQGVQ